ncbi:hypothetical protein SAMN05216371_7052 [Streptomyces sp. TLI_053]|uniref:hypothetical protein n=1 Tax=Streptomyces sp. TLI_053 TaxID=1855352 RepID=UPI00087ACEF7|nr:hypothetical protein [Streptomyces sp. TLI_053]SDT82254.1 hypothetical protein SAMN05216371_7052 [Streptomyces sp. TLI_053]
MEHVTRTRADAHPLRLETLTMTAAAAQLTITRQPVDAPTVHLTCIVAASIPAHPAGGAY